MKMHNRTLLILSLAGLLARSTLADEQPGIINTNTPPVIPAESPKASAAKQRKPAASAKRTDKKTAAGEFKQEAPSIEPGPAVARQNNVNVRGKAAINAEVIAHLQRGDKVTVLDEVTLKKPKVDEPAKWAKIALPPAAAVWVNKHFIDDTTKTVKVKKLNLRSGPGENYSVIGLIEKGATVKDTETKGDWIKIEPPNGAYAFVAAHLLAKDTTAVAATTPKPSPVETQFPPRPALPPPPSVAINTPPIVATPPPTAVIPPPPIATPAPVFTPPPTPASAPPPDATPVLTPTPPSPAPIEAATPKPPPAPVEEILVKRVVTREGIVKRAVSIQSPTYFVLEGLDNKKTINYLYSPSTNIVLKDFNGQRILVTGEELLDERWPNTPVINVETLQAVEQ